MAGWDHYFDVDLRDVDLFRNCMRIFRRTCARHYVEMDYHRARALSSGRLRYLIGYNLSSVNLGVACGEFVYEMRALSVLESHPRRKRLPLRLLRDVAYSAVYTLEEQVGGGEIEEPSTELKELLESFQSSFWSWRTGVLPAPEFLEAQHGLVTNLALLVADDAHTSDSFPALVKKLAPVADEVQAGLLQLGKDRNKVKHRGHRARASEYIHAGLDAVWYVSARVTGFYPDPVSPEVRQLVDDPSSVFRSPPMYTRAGARRVVRR